MSFFPIKLNIRGGGAIPRFVHHDSPIHPSVKKVSRYSPPFNLETGFKSRNNVSRAINSNLTRMVSRWNRKRDKNWPRTIRTLRIARKNISWDLFETADSRFYFCSFLEEPDYHRIQALSDDKWPSRMTTWVLGNDWRKWNRLNDGEELVERVEGWLELKARLFLVFGVRIFD